MSLEYDFASWLYKKTADLYRDMPWRRDTRGYYVLVSELMLQQTQVDRVMPKFEQFIDNFPDFESLAKAKLADVLVLWSGLGYNRRAKYLHDAAKMVVASYRGLLPDEYNELIKLPGVGANTAGAILAYTYNQPVVFVETNIRTVYFYHFFQGRQDVSDATIRKKLDETLDRNDPRQFYWALMDYGTHLKRSGVKNISASRHYKKQSSLKGSVREVRGSIVRILAASGVVTYDALRHAADPGDGRFATAYSQLLQEGLLQQQGDLVSLTQ